MRTQNLFIQHSHSGITPYCIAITTWILTTAVFARYFLKLSDVICGKCDDGETSDFSKSSPHVFLKKSVSRLFRVGSFNTAGKFTRDIKMVHWSWSRTTEGADCANSNGDLDPLGVGLRDDDCLPNADIVSTSFRSAMHEQTATRISLWIVSLHHLN